MGFVRVARSITALEEAVFLRSYKNNSYIKPITFADYIAEEFATGALEMLEEMFNTVISFKSGKDELN